MITNYIPAGAKKQNILHMRNSTSKVDPPSPNLKKKTKGAQRMQRMT